MDRVGEDVRRELRRFGPGEGMAAVVEAWPAVVGEEIARNAWPARLARDGTLHVHTRDSIWAFELAGRADEIRTRLAELAPVRVAFAPGPLPEPAEPDAGERRARVAQPTAEHVARAESLARAICDEDLRKVVAKTVALSLASADYDRFFW